MAGTDAVTKKDIDDAILAAVVYLRAKDFANFWLEVAAARALMMTWADSTFTSDQGEETLNWRRRVDDLKYLGEKAEQAYNSGQGTSMLLADFT